MKKMMMMSAALSMVAVSGLAQAADFNTLKTPTTATAQTPYGAPQPTPQPTTTVAPAPKKAISLKGARIVPDTSPAPDPAAGNTSKISDQGYSKASAYNVVNDQNKPITNDWTRPKSWRIGYKNKNRTPINE